MFMAFLGCFWKKHSEQTEGVCDSQVGLGLKEAWPFSLRRVAEQKFGEE